MLYINRISRSTAFLCLVILVAVNIQGCSNFGFYAQSIAGGLEVLTHREPITDVLENPDVSQDVKDKLKFVLQARTFASKQLSLPDNDSYRTYVDLKRPYAVWNVFAAPEFSMQMKEWCFLFAGCVKYRGYFDEKDADNFASELKKQGLDVFVAGIDAYSTLGWFDDPMLNTVIKRDKTQLAELIFHELAHQEVYVKGDTVFNEGFAVAVANEGIKRWLTQQGSPEQTTQYHERKQREQQFIELVTQTRGRLEDLYQSHKDDSQLREEKANIIQDMQFQYQQLKTRWNGYAGYDNWFSMPINNAQIAAIVTYQDYVPAFENLLVQQHNDLAAFFQAVKKLGELPIDQRHAELRQLGATAPVT